jgi:hypothetical protein
MRFMVGSLKIGNKKGRWGEPTAKRKGPPKRALQKGLGGKIAHGFVLRVGALVAQIPTAPIAMIRRSTAMLIMCPPGDETSGTGGKGRDYKAPPFLFVKSKSDANNGNIGKDVCCQFGYGLSFCFQVLLPCNHSAMVAYLCH